MKPLPEAVQRAFPCEAGAVLSRPWWYLSRYGRNHAKCYRRVDEPNTIATTIEEVAAHNAAHPLPHPGYRAGQVWAAEDGESTTILRAIGTQTGTQLCVAENPEAVPPHDFDCDYPYLMADPSCPWLAPWSPAEVKP